MESTSGETEVKDKVGVLISALEKLPAFKQDDHLR